MRPLFKSTLALATLALLSTGCSTQNKIMGLHADTTDEAQTLSERAKNQTRSSERVRIEQQDVNQPYLIGGTIPLAREVSMPPVLKKRVTILFDRAGVDLQTAARQISEASQVSISLTQDALMPMSSFGPRLTASAQSPAIKSAASESSIQLSSIARDTELFKVLDEVARQAGVHWRSAGSGIEFYRTETRIFKVNASPQTATTSATLGRNGGTGQVFEAQSKTGFELQKQDPLAGMRNTVDAMLTTGGRLTVSPESQTFVVTDTPEALARVSSYIAEMNKSMSRRVRVVVEAVEVTAKDSTQLGLDWNAVYKSLNATGSTGAVNAIGSLVGLNAGSVSVKDSAGRFAGSEVAVRALSEIGNIVNRKSFPFITTSGRPVTQALRNTFNYVDSASVSQSSSITTTQQAPTVTQKEETVGTFLTVTPVAKDNGQIYLTLSYDVTTADPLTSYTVGGSSNSVTVQQKSINGTGIVQEIPMRSGQTLVVGGYDSVLGNLTQRRAAPGAPLLLGGSDSGTYQKSIVVFLVTAVTEDGY
jgi:type IVB pilus formation R64 PilN family outer membrane protein